MSTPWDDLAPYEQERIAALPFDEMIAALCDHAPKASAGEILSLLGDDTPKSRIRAARDRWKVARGNAPSDEPEVPRVPTRDAVLAQLQKAIQVGNSREVDRWARSLAALARAGNIDPEPATTEEWDRLSDREAGILIALTRKLNGEILTTADEQWLDSLR
jgi:hypothetical protein